MPAWELKHRQSVILCPECGFGVHVNHADDHGDHRCPACAERRLHARVAELEKALRALRGSCCPPGCNHLGECDDDKNDFVAAMALGDAALRASRWAMPLRASPSVSDPSWLNPKPHIGPRQPWKPSVSKTLGAPEKGEPSTTPARGPEEGAGTLPRPSEVLPNSGDRCEMHGAPRVGTGFECGCDQGRDAEDIASRIAREQRPNEAVPCAWCKGLPTYPPCKICQPRPQEARVKPGVYKHYKGGRYEVLCTGRLSEERDQVVVVYRSLDRAMVWVRPFRHPIHDSWCDEVEWPDGERRARFVLETPQCADKAREPTPASLWVVLPLYGTEPIVIERTREEGEKRLRYFNSKRIDYELVEYVPRGAPPRPETDNALPVDGHNNNALPPIAEPAVLLSLAAALRCARRHVAKQRRGDEENEQLDMIDASLELLKSPRSAKAPAAVTSETVFDLDAILDEIVQRWEGPWQDHDEDAFTAAISRLKGARRPRSETAKPPELARAFDLGWKGALAAGGRIARDYAEERNRMSEEALREGDLEQRDLLLAHRLAANMIAAKISTLAVPSVREKSVAEDVKR